MLSLSSYLISPSPFFPHPVLFLLFSLIWSKVTLCNPVRALSHDPPPSMFPILRLKACISCITIPSFGLGFLVVVDLCLNAHELF